MADQPFRGALPAYRIPECIRSHLLRELIAHGQPNDLSALHIHNSTIGLIPLFFWVIQSTHLGGATFFTSFEKQFETFEQISSTSDLH
jgi:hypothetical protein